ncbi:MAG: ketoacyl-ACP synthase III [Myxococcota bacterium]
MHFGVSGARGRWYSFGSGGPIRFRISRTALHAPPDVETADDLAARLGRSAEWIAGRTGVAVRHVCRTSMAEMGAAAALEALNGASPDLIVNASLTPIQLIPDSSVFIQEAMGLSGTPSFSIHATCLSFVVALQNVGALVQSGAYQRVVVVSSEQGSVCRDFSEPESAALIGDGAAAAVIEPAPEGSGAGLVAFAMRTWPEGASSAELRGCGTRRHPNDPETVAADNLFQMHGPRIWKLSLRHVDEMLDEAFGAAGMARDDVDVVIPHQASGPMLEMFQRYGFSDHKVVKVVAEYGNCIAASLPMALHAAIESGRLKRGQRALLFGTGAGLSIASAILEY